MLNKMEAGVITLIAKKLIKKALELGGDSYVYDFPQDHIDYLNDLMEDYDVKLSRTKKGNIRIEKVTHSEPDLSED